MTKDEALDLALEALDSLQKMASTFADELHDKHPDVIQARVAVTAIKQALAAPVQEPVKFEIGGRYNWKGQPERLIYLGCNFSGNGLWHQFAKVGEPETIWCEVLTEDLASFEATPPAALPAVPDAMTSADIQEHIEYVAGWNDCRQAMLEMMK
jgi:hypothetical protein